MKTLVPKNKIGERKTFGLTPRIVPTFDTWMDEIFNRNFGTEFMPNFNEGMSLPKVNVLDLDEKYLVEMAVPGFKKGDFKIDLDNKLMTISAETKDEVHEEIHDNYTRKEFGYSSFQRAFTLPEFINYDKIVAKYEDGILKVALPKFEEAKKKPAKTIKIS